MVGSAFMQVCLPVFVLIHWLHDKDDVRDEHVTWREVFQDFDASMVESYRSLEIRFVKGVVATYVLLYVLLKDYKWLYKLLYKWLYKLLYNPTPKEVLLSGVGALFVLEIDDLLVPMSQNYL
ncbi:hypothetical protein PLESTM_001935900, partial [Pleodorina starrii]